MALLRSVTETLNGVSDWQVGSAFITLGFYVVFHVIDKTTFTVLNYYDIKRKRQLAKRPVDPTTSSPTAELTTADTEKKLAAKFFNMRRAGLYINSLVHALITAIWSLYLLYTYGILRPEAAVALATHDSSAPGPGLADTASIRAMGSISVAYFAYDFVATAPDWYTHPTDFFHHLLGLGLTTSFLVSEACARLGQHLFVLETSTIFFDVSWVLKKVGYDGTKIDTYLLVCFAIFFAILRQFYLPYVTYVSWVYLYDDFVANVPHVGIAMILLSLLNTYWMYKILRKLQPEPKLENKTE